jgi:hypothetical protein
MPMEFLFCWSLEGLILIVLFLFCCRVVLVFAGSFVDFSVVWLELMVLLVAAVVCSLDYLVLRLVFWPWVVPVWN